MKTNSNYPMYPISYEYDLFRMLIQRAALYPERIAFTCFKNDGSTSNVTYNQFLRDVTSLGGYLRERYHDRSHIGIMGDNSYEWLLVFMTAVCYGYVAVALDRGQTAEELEDVMHKTDISVLFCDNSGIEKTKSITDRVFVFFEDIADIIQNKDPNGIFNQYDNQVSSFDPDNTCCIFFTSGTSGDRKAVMLSYHNLTADIKGSCQLFELTGSTYVILPFHHAFGLIVAVWMVFYYGQTVNIGSGLRRIRQELTVAKPQTMMLVPLFVETFHKQIWETVRKEGKEKEMLCQKRH